MLLRPELPNWQLPGESPPAQAPVLGSTTEAKASGLSHCRLPVCVTPEIEEMMLAVAAQFALAIQNVRWTQDLHQAYQDTLYRLSLVAKYREDPSGAQIRR